MTLPLPATGRIGIIAAMRDELSAVLDRMPDEHKTRVAGRSFWRGHWHGREVVAVLSRIGKVAAATTATALVERFGATRIVFTGVAGGIGAGVQVGDAVVASEFLQHDMDASPLFPRHELPLYGLSRLPADADLSERLLRALARSLPEVRVHQGLIVSGDRFVSTTQQARDLQALLPDALAVEMEGAAVAQVCFDYGVPFAAVRMISDRADDEAHGDFNRFVQEVASHRSAAIVRALLA